MNQNQTDSISLQENGSLGGNVNKLKLPKMNVSFTKTTVFWKKLEMCLLSSNRGQFSKR